MTMPDASLSTRAHFHARYAEWFGEPAEVTKTGSYGDLCVYPPAEDARPRFFTYVTAGTSLKKMTVPADAEDTGRVELVFYAEQQDARYVDALTLLMTFPFVDKTWLGFGHTVALAGPIEDSGALTHVLLLHTLVRGHAKAFETVRVKGEPVSYLWPVPITRAELKLKQEQGVNALIDVLEAQRHPWVFSGGRRSYV
jgi:hypothetical protein